MFFIPQPKSDGPLASLASPFTGPSNVLCSFEAATLLFTDGGLVMRKYRIVELYAGTARSVEPFRSWRRAELALLLDANAFARKTYLLNYPDAPYIKRSISALQSNDLTRLADGRIDVLLGCPPCQGFSESGLRL